jgi:hypothetical protein
MALPQFIPGREGSVARMGFDDSAAKTFARKFYAAMLDGEPFGEAVRLARSETYATHGGVNTWGAYQCYGDPDYRLTLEPGEQELRLTKPMSPLKWPWILKTSPAGTGCRIRRLPISKRNLT